ncbi:MAG: Uma2 family endonuclease [Planctomycetota bacterium]|nr:Uma2 family endonuclease [Planctomycetota bacterium]
MRTDIKFTYEEYRALPETGPRYQLVDGDLLMSPSPTSRHQAVLVRLLNALVNHAERSEAGRVFCAPLDVILSEEDVFQPDLLFISREHGSRIASEGIRGVPDLCVEVLSPSTRDLDLKTKRRQYARFGLPELWIVDPDANSLHVFRLQEDADNAAAVLTAKDTLTTPLLPGFTLKLDKLFEK